MPEQMVCTPKLLPRHKWESAAKIATEINPVNHPPVERLVRVVAGFSPTPEHISVLTTKYWGVAGLRLTVGFLDNPPADLRARILSRRETGHTMGFPHEHMRRELVNEIDPDKAIAYFGATQGWSPAEVRQQVLTPIEESSLRGTAHADPDSIMCYQIPASITKSGKPIVGGLDIDRQDFAFAALIYPKVAKPKTAPKRKAKARSKGKAVRKSKVKHRSVERR
jgi:hypothetical protein